MEQYTTATTTTGEQIVVQTSNGQLQGVSIELREKTNKKRMPKSSVYRFRSGMYRTEHRRIQLTTTTMYTPHPHDTTPALTQYCW